MTRQPFVIVIITEAFVTPLLHLGWGNVLDGEPNVVLAGKARGPKDWGKVEPGELLF
jgi:hypothetical protein